MTFQLIALLWTLMALTFVIVVSRKPNKWTSYVYTHDFWSDLSQVEWYETLPVSTRKTVVKCPPNLVYWSKDLDEHVFVYSYFSGDYPRASDRVRVQALFGMTEVLASGLKRVPVSKLNTGIREYDPRRINRLLHSYGRTSPVTEGWGE